LKKLWHLYSLLVISTGWGAGPTISNYLSEEKNLRETTGAKFELESMSKKYQKFLPLYNPTIYGVDSQGIIYFILPGIPQEEDYLKRFLVTFYYKTYNLLKDCGGNCGKK
jgi:hypothetical protein